MSDGPRIIYDRGTGRPILISPGRLKRPRNTGPDQDGASDCPFCAGSEHRTPAEIDAIRSVDSSADGPGWTARAFPNLYPAAACHEVIAEGEEHTIHPAAIPLAILADSLDLYRRRIAAVEATTDVRLAILFKNVGAQAGASIAHNHSQMLGLPMVPPRLQQELAACATGCFHCDEIATAAAEDRVVCRLEHHVILCPSTPKLPFETWMLPLDHGDDFLAPNDPAALAAAYLELFDRVDRAFDGSAFNLCLHRIPDTDFHWHFELQPRSGQMAALEIGADMYINAVTPQASAAHWRGE